MKLAADRLPARSNPTQPTADFEGYAPLVTGFINSTSGLSWGRPVDVQMAPGGADAFFVSDDKSNSILRFA